MASGFSRRNQPGSYLDTARAGAALNKRGVRQGPAAARTPITHDCRWMLSVGRRPGGPGDGGVPGRMSWNTGGTTPCFSTLQIARRLVRWMGRRCAAARALAGCPWRVELVMLGADRDLQWLLAVHRRASAGRFWISRNRACGLMESLRGPARRRALSTSRVGLPRRRPKPKGARGDCCRGVGSQR